MASPDGNNGYPLLVVDNNGNVATALVDNSTGYLLIEIKNSAASPTSQPSGIDENNENVGIVENDSGTIVPILVDKSDEDRIFISFTAL